MLGEAEIAAAKKLSENEARVTELTDRWKDRWKETQRILEVCTTARSTQVIFVWNCSGFQGLHGHEKLWNLKFTFQAPVVQRAVKTLSSR